MKKTIQETVASVQNAPSSIFTKEDVITLLSNLQAADSVTKFDQQMITDLCEAICDHVESTIDGLASDDVVDLGSAEFSLSGNEIELESVELSRHFSGEVTNGLADVIEDFYKKLTEEADEEELEEANN